MDHSLYFKEPPHESLWLIFDCSLNTIQEIFSIIDMLRSVPYPENEIIESLSNIRFSDLTMNQLKYIHGKVKWSEKTEYLLEELVEEFNRQRKDKQVVKLPQPIIKKNKSIMSEIRIPPFMKKPIKLNK